MGVRKLRNFSHVVDTFFRALERQMVVTSTHVLKAAGKDPLCIPLRMIGADEELPLVIVKIGGAQGKQPFYVSHPALDVTAFPLLLPAELEPRFALRLLEEGNLVDGENVSFLGFPEGLPGTPDLFPVLREGRIASSDPGLQQRIPTTLNRSL